MKLHMESDRGEAAAAAANTTNTAGTANMPGAGRHGTILVIGAMCLGIFLCMLDTTIMNIALPAIQTGLDTDLNSLSWALNVYTILFAALSIPLGRVAEIVGMHRTYIVGLAVFLAGSLGSGLAWGLAPLIAFRAMQSLGAAIVFPSSMTIGISSASLQSRTGVIAALGVTQGLASALGPVIGGVLTQYLGWRWVFFVNLPLGLLALAICLTQLRIKGEPKVKAGIDWVGSLLLMASLFSLVLAFIQGSAWGWASPAIIALFIVAAIGLVAFVAAERRACSPMIDLRLFANRQFVGSSIVILVGYFFLVGVTVLLPTFFTKIQGTSELKAALLVTPVSLLIFLVTPISGLLLAKIGPRVLLAAGFAALSGGYLLLGRMDPTNLAQVITAGALVGAGFGMIVAPLTILSAADFTGELLTASQSVIGVIGRIGIVLAVAVFVTTLTGNIATQRTAAIEGTKATVASLTSLPQQTRDILLKESLASIESGATKAAATPTNHVTPAQRQQLIDANTRKVIVEQHLEQAPESVKSQVAAQIATQVDKEIKHTNETVNAAIATIKTQTTTRFEAAFTSIYSIGACVIPFGLTTVFLFPRKKASGKQ
ncbi:MAG: MFS transporter [Bifidobacterium subtile]|uniref:MFS transporter n=1 Tax=Bifidobacterium tibiigranuli TaxID=2172043 RepID=UPI002352BFC6|nr:MFS transporter [Bifidobacterium tibiigranuli]MCI1258986.1 MFS transporter [Bifidobacterium subtile]MCH3975907.1 MFS transporter [Bifidobacterium tibiigranuli]MCH4190197.1 MFS transporter [Bifidobacterium tibiigranuli]MCH4204384.1 MFS transporter [Bifidobacterium tibiigranuli]MCH4275095.1 MFS transporter [Bifidobacterium tibiigranuli]